MKVSRAWTRLIYNIWGPLEKATEYTGWLF
jgi:hypothetical protein